MTHGRYVEPIRILPSYPAAVPSHYNVEVEVYRGYWIVEWFKEQFGHLEQQGARQQGVTAEMLFERLLEQVPPGAMGLMLQPYWSPGLTSSPDRKPNGLSSVLVMSTPAPTSTAPSSRDWPTPCARAASVARNEVGHL